VTELEAAKLIAEGKLPSPYKFGEMTLFGLKATGTGMSYRDSLDEFVWRDIEIFTAPEFVERAGAGVPVIWEHPDKGSLTSKEFGNRAIGSTMLGFVKNDECWVVARIYDSEAIKLMTNSQLSTSPGVVFRPGDGNVSGEIAGETLLIEGRPSILDHLAVVKNGVWDHGGPPTGVQNDLLPPPTNGDLGMAEEDDKKADADKSRQDAAAKLDAFMDAIHTKMDAIHAKFDSFEKDKKDKARHDAARKDKFSARKDGEKFNDWAKRHDADEKAMADALKCDWADEKDCKDAARAARHDAEEDEKKNDKDFDKWSKEDSAVTKKDAEVAKKDSDNFKDDPDKFKDSAKKDSEASEEKKEEAKPDARKDSAVARENEELKTRMAKLEGLMKGITTELPGTERDALATAQSRADSVSAMLGDRAPAPMAGETSLDYRRRLVKRFAPHSPTLKAARFDSLDDGTLTLLEDRVYADAANAARTTGDASPGVLIPFEERDRSGRFITKYYGDIGAFMAPFMSGATVGRIIRKPGA